MSNCAISDDITTDELYLVELFRDFKRQVRDNMSSRSADEYIRANLDMMRISMSRNTPVELFPMGEMPERLRLMKRLLQQHRRFQGEPNMEFTAQQVAIMLCLDLRQLRKASCERKLPIWSDRVDSLISAGKLHGIYLIFVWFFVNCSAALSPGPGESDLDDHTSRIRQWAEQKVHGSTSICSLTIHTDMLSQVQQRDRKRCLYTKVDEINSFCYIFHPSGSNSKQRIESLSQDFVMAPFFPRSEATYLINLLALSRQSTYESWNILTLSETIRMLWRSSNLAIVWVGSEPDVDSGMDEEGNPLKTFAILQLRWLTRKIQDAERKVCLDGKPQDLIKRLLGDKVPIRLEHRLIFPHKDRISTIPSGTLTKVLLDTEDIPKMKAVIDLQWLCMRLLVLSGAAGRWHSLMGSFAGSITAEA